jgi:tRNA (cmo5U34)-methyltransferase
MSKKQVSVGDGIQTSNAAWSFGGEVARHFDDHVSKSVPLYDEGHKLACLISDYFVTEKSNCYELGCSTGTLTALLGSRHANKKDASFHGVDVEPNMITVAKNKRTTGNVSFTTEDILQFEMEEADLIVAYCTIQFIRPKARQWLVDRIYQSMNWGGAFILYEKVRACDARFQDIMTGVYHEMKIESGYSGEEIIGKSRSLKGVLEPFSTEGNREMLKRAGFDDVLTVMKHTCFEMFLAIK